MGRKRFHPLRLLLGKAGEEVEHRAIEGLALLEIGDVAGTRLSRGELAALGRLVRVRDGGLESTGERLGPAELEACGLAAREVAELLDKLARPPVADDFRLDLSQARDPEEFAREMEAAVPKVDRA